MNKKPSILLVAATSMELQLLEEQLTATQKEGNLTRGRLGDEPVVLLPTGIGIVNTAFSLGKLLATHSFQCAVNLGIAGAYDMSLKLGEVVEVHSDSFTDMGADSPTGFLSLEEIGFPVLATKEKAYIHTLENPYPSLSSLKQVQGATVNTVSGQAEKIALHKRQWNKQVESMEGAAFFHAMLQTDIPFYAFRAISNYVTARDTSSWDIPMAVKKAQLFVLNFVKEALQ
ncbi:MAG: futalosine hydrolase [Bacteroidota bacterium]